MHVTHTCSVLHLDDLLPAPAGAVADVAPGLLKEAGEYSSAALRCHLTESCSYHSLQEAHISLVVWTFQKKQPSWRKPMGLGCPGSPPAPGAPPRCRGGGGLPPPNKGARVAPLAQAPKAANRRCPQGRGRAENPTPRWIRLRWCAREKPGGGPLAPAGAASAWCGSGTAAARAPRDPPRPPSAADLPRTRAARGAVPRARASEVSDVCRVKTWFSSSST